MLFKTCSLNDGRTGVFSWCVISSFYFAWNVNLGNYSSWLVTWRFRVTPEEPELSSDIRDFTSLFHVILRCKFSEWLEWPIESDLSMRFAIWSIDLAIVNFKLPSNTVSNVRTGHHKKEYHTLLFSWFGKTKFLYPWTVVLYFLGSWTVPETPPVRPS